MNLPNLKKALDDYMNDVARIYKDKLNNDGHKATGKLINSVKAEVVVGNTSYTGQLKLEDYWKYIEYGTKPHWPPTNSILQWITAKHIIPRPGTTGIVPTNHQLAFLIGRKISRDGTKPGRELGKTIDEVNLKYKSILEQALQKDIENELAVIKFEF